MKLLITGHTYGLGKAIWDNLNNDHELVGISRSTGYDLTDHETVLKVIDMSIDFDHVLNICKVDPAQTDILLGIHQLWDERKKRGKIISIGGLTESFSWNMIRMAPVHQTSYIGAKHNLAKAHFDLSSIHPYRSQPQSVLIRPLNIGMRENERRDEPYLLESEVVEVIKFALERNYYLSTIDLRQICS
jgi:hypothetical protein